MAKLWQRGPVTVSIVRDPRFLAHDQGPSHPESPARLAAIDARLASSPLGLRSIEPRPATAEELLRVHTPEHLAKMEAARGKAMRLDPDTATSPGSVDAAYWAAGGSIALCRAITKKEAPPGLALVRPPGHHATPERAMGFCLFNNVAVAARALQAEGLAERIAIYDWDVHHGNGTQDAFYDDPSVLYLSTHQWPFYPGTGAATETGAGPGEGTTLNVPLPAGTDDATLLEVSEQVLLPRVRDFRPDVILISAGFDPYVGDPLGGLDITVGGFAALATLWREEAEALCGGRIGGILEGGYDVRGLAECVEAVLRAWDR